MSTTFSSLLTSGSSASTSAPSSRTPLQSILSASQVPHQPFLIVEDTVECSGVAVIRELIRRDLGGEDDGGQDDVEQRDVREHEGEEEGEEREGGGRMHKRSVLLITTLYPAEYFVPRSDSRSDYDRSRKTQNGERLQVLDLSNQIPGYTDIDNREGETSSSYLGLEGIYRWITSRLDDGKKVENERDLKTTTQTTADENSGSTHIYIDSLDHLVSDGRCRNSSEVLVFVKKLLRRIGKMQAPSRITLLSPSSSQILPHLITASFSSSLSLLSLNHPRLLSHLSDEYLILPRSDPSQDPRFYNLLQRASGRQQATATALALQGEDGWALDDWQSTSNGDAVRNRDPNGHCGIIVDVLVRKTQGGAQKGMIRSLEGLRVTRRGRGRGRGRNPASSGYGSGSVALQVCAWSDLPELADVGKKFQLHSSPSDETAAEPQGATPKKPTTTTTTISKEDAVEYHPSQKEATFNLGTTSSQSASRAQVPIPYAHEGETTVHVSTPGTMRLGNIIFEPGSEDDMDEDDPDEDLDF